MYTQAHICLYTSMGTHTCVYIHITKQVPSLHLSCRHTNSHTYTSTHSLVCEHSSTLTHTLSCNPTTHLYSYVHMQHLPIHSPTSTNEPTNTYVKTESTLNSCTYTHALTLRNTYVELTLLHKLLQKMELRLLHKVKVMTHVC